MKQTYLKKLFLQLMAIIAFASCTSSEEPLTAISQNPQTRGLDNIESTYSIHQAIQIANKKLQKNAADALKAKTTVLLATDSECISNLLSDTVAYIINYANKSGFAIIGNDNRLENPILAYNEEGNFSQENILAKAFFLNNIEKYLASFNIKKNSNVKESKNIEPAPTRRLIVEPQITIELSPFSPFNDKIAKEHPECCAGFINVSAANIISHSFKKLVYHNCLYNFETINYALNQGPGFNPINPGGITTGISDNFPSTFIYSYDGSVTAFTQLLYDISKDSGTFYGEGTTITMPSGIERVYRNLGLTVTESNTKRDINEITSLLYNGYFVNVFLIGRMVEGGIIDIDFLKGPQGYVIDGCNVLIGNDKKIVSGEVHVVWGLGGFADGYYAYPVLLYDDVREMVELSHIGVKGSN